MSKTKTLVTAGVLALKRFTVLEICKYTGLRQTQVYPVLSELQKQELIRAVGPAPNAGGERLRSGLRGQRKPANRPASLYELTADEGRVQALEADIYVLRRAIHPRPTPDDGDLTLIKLRLEALDDMLDLCETNVRLQPVRTETVRKIQSRLNVAHSLLEKATYSRSLSLRDDSTDGHPVAALWERWRAVSDNFDSLVDLWNGNSRSDLLGALVLPRSIPFRTLSVVTAPSFFDSALFLWLFWQQPFMQAGLNVHCELVPVDWKDVPATVAKQPHAIGFYNRHLEGKRPAQGVSYLMDLSVYKGYAVLAHRLPWVKVAPKTLADSEAFLKQFVKHCHAEGEEPKLISIGADTIWQFDNQLTPNVGLEVFSHEEVPNASEALQRFRENRCALFVGGLPQRLAAERDGCVPVITAQQRPSLFSINGLIVTRQTNIIAPALINSIATLWLHTMTRLNRDIEFRKTTVESMQKMGVDLGLEEISNMNAGDVEKLFADGLEFFPETPAQIAKHIADQKSRVVRMNVGQLSDKHPELQNVSKAMDGLDRPLKDDNWSLPKDEKATELRVLN
jgi:hypothetical protein